MTAWINQVAGNGILRKIKPERTPWPEYRKWVVPDKFVWVLITSGILLLIGIGFVKDLGKAPPVGDCIVSVSSEKDK